MVKLWGFIFIYQAKLTRGGGGVVLIQWDYYYERKDVRTVNMDCIVIGVGWVGCD